MSTVVISRPPRQHGPERPQGELELPEPPALPEMTGADVVSTMSALPMLLGSGAMVLMFASPNAGPLVYLGAGLMGLSSIGMLVAQLSRTAIERKRRLHGERRDYLRYLAQARTKVRTAMTAQRAAIVWDHPQPQQLRWLAMGPRVWERRSSHQDFAEVRIAVGRRRAAFRVRPPQTKPVEDLEPLCAVALRRFIQAASAVSDTPAVVYLRGLPLLSFSGDRHVARGMVRALLAQLVTFHAPDDVRIGFLTGGAESAHWRWAKWLPHNAHQSEVDAAGAVRLFADEHDDLLRLLGPGFAARPAFDGDARPGPAEPLLVIVVDGVELPPGSRLTSGVRNTVVLDLTAEHEHPVLAVTAEQVRLRRGDSTELVGRPDQLDEADCELLARQLAPLRLGGAVDTSEPLTTDFDLVALLGIGDPRGFDVAATWRERTRWGALRVPIGIGETGEVVELDIKESAQGGMGPHGVLIGATGSGKSELLRTLVIALATTHSPEKLNFVLVDFKGGATFLGMDALPHVSAVITNLADELSMVDRMQDSLHGELIRRQELLRRQGYSSLLEYEKARAKGAVLDPLPTLLVVVDEFSELLANKPEFMELFVMIGRLGRSLGVHLLLASQRLDEGRIHQVESHLSYRIALRTFSAMESRSVIGVSDAYELPAAPGNGYLKVDTNTLLRFKAGYVAGPCPVAATDSAPRPSAADEIVPFGTGYLAPRAAVVPPPAVEDDDRADDDTETLLDVLLARLRGQGPVARRVWLPPLSVAPSLDELLPTIEPDAARGLTATQWSGSGALRIPVGIVDKPFEQAREVLIADFSGAAGNAAIVGAPQSGKSTLLRSLVTALAVTHTAAEVQCYCLDFGGGTLAGLAGLPHVGSVATRLDRERVKRTIAELTGLLERREQTFGPHGIDSMARYRRMRAGGAVDDPHGDVFLLVDGWFTLRQDFEELEAAVAELATRGLGYGIHVVITASRWSEIRPWLRDLLGTRFELKLGDPLESEIGSRMATGVPAQPGRGLTREGKHFLAALPRIDGAADTDDLAAAIKVQSEEIADFWAGPPAPPVRMLPLRLAAAELPAASGDVTVALGLGEARLEPVRHDFDQTPHLMVFGDAETGKTNLLRLIARAIVQRYSPEEARVLVADPRRGLQAAIPEAYRIGYAVNTEALAELAAGAAVSMQKRLPGPDITPDRLRNRDWWSGPRLFLLIDDYDLVGGGLAGPLDPLLPLLSQGCDIAMNLVIARSSSGAMRAMMDPLLRRLWELGTPGLLLSFPKEEGKFLGEAPPAQLPPGRAQLVTRRSVQLVQTALVEPSTEDGGIR
ncbi:type VII secretion protein EccCa [Saccharopolyspora sp. 5N708]|uniref:type VII secretion protein EccCa n=1 Tax=Saccharopolyspora sp. 5N708 TaxID=3457424 RepID=UPI003FD2E514